MRPPPLWPGGESRAGHEGKQARGKREVTSCFVKSLMGEIKTILCKVLSPVKAGEGRA